MARKASKKAIETHGESNKDQTHKSNSIVPMRWKLAYELTKLPGTCGDKMAQAFAEAIVTEEGPISLVELRKIGTANKVDVAKRWGHCNPGQQRMNLSNVLRGMVRRGETVKIGSETFGPVKAKKAKAVKAPKQADAVAA